MINGEKKGSLPTWSVVDIANEQDGRRGWFSGLGVRNTATSFERCAPHPHSPSTKSALPTPTGWKPLSLSPQILGFVIALTLLLAAAIETLAQRSLAKGGLALSPTLDDIPTYAMLAYLYVPNIVAVLYSLIWSWIDLDVKRMQPWFELSKENGATAENSLFLDYQYDFVALVPFRAAKRRHWPVFFAGTTMVLVFWLLTPLQSALLGTGVVAQTNIVNIANRSTLRPLADQEVLLNPKVLNTAYAIGWLGQPYPPFTTAEYAVLPFYAERDPAPPNVETNWTATTTKLSTELSCWPAQMERDGPRSKNSFHFLNGKGCNATLSFNQFANYTMLYIGYSSSPYSDYWLGGPDCPKTADSVHQFLALWAKPIKVPDDSTPDWNITALYCQTSYYKQQVQVKVKSGGFESEDEALQTLSPRETLSEKDFNSTAFEFLLANGMTDQIVVKDFPFNIVVEQQPRLNSTGLTRPVSNMVGFALAGQDLPTEAYSDPEVLKNIYYHAHQHLFSVAVNDLLMNETSFSNHTLSVDFFLSAIIVSRTFSIVVECLLVIVACFAGVVVWKCRTAKSNLPMNPSSIGRIIDLVRDSPELLASFSLTDNADEKMLLKAFEKDGFRLLYDKQSSRMKILIDKTSAESPPLGEREVGFQKGFYEPVKPWVLRREIGVLFVAVLIGAIVGLSYLKAQETTLNGLRRPSTNFEVLQLLENYIPTIFATFIEPLWVLLNRLLCVLQPFKDLWEGKAKPANSIDATYTSIPPQLAFWRAIKLRHFVLVLVCAMALLSNVLAVGLGALFNEEPTVAKYSKVLQPAFAPRFDNQSVFDFGAFMSQNLITTNQYSDHMYIALANITSGTILPPWVSQEYFFQRYELEDLNTSQAEDTFSITTRGFGANANCTSIPAFKLPNLTSVDIPKDNTTCASLLDSAVVQMRESTFNRTSGASAIEYIMTLTSSSGPEPCDLPLTLGWGRTAKAQDINGTVHASFAFCHPIFETAMFNLTVDRSGHVLSYNRTGDLETTLDYPQSKLHTDIMFEHMNHEAQQRVVQWHNDTVSRDWVSYLMMSSIGSRAFLDPSEPVPDPEDLVPVAEDVYRRLYAVLLSLNEHLFDHNNRGESATAIRSTKETRIFMDEAAFIISMTVLALNTIVAGILYARAVAFVLPRMPTTLGSVLAYVAPSRIASTDYKGVLGQAARTFSFGRYIGKDGEVHLGVEMDPHVVPVDPASFKEKRGVFRRFGTGITNNEMQPVKAGAWL